MRSEICIVGGGPAGLAAALALTQAGREVTVLDRAVPPIDKACGEGLLPDSIAALAKLGVVLPPETGTPLRGIRFFSGNSQVTANFPIGAGRGLRRVLLHEQLVMRAQRAGIRLLWGVKNVATRRGVVTFTGGQIETPWIVGADGQNSLVRRQSGLTQYSGETRRYGFRRHYDVAPWSPYVEVYWGRHFQIYITPVAGGQVCAALLSRDPHLRLNAALSRLPALAERLRGSVQISAEMGSLSVSRSLRRVSGNGYVLLGDASGSVDAITGEGMSLAFQQSAALVQALDAGDTRLYERAHKSIAAKPRRMAALLLLLDSHERLRRRALAGLASYPPLFERLLAAHVS